MKPNIAKKTTKKPVNNEPSELSKLIIDICAQIDANPSRASEKMQLMASLHDLMEKSQDDSRVITDADILSLTPNARQLALMGLVALALHELNNG